MNKNQNKHNIIDIEKQILDESIPYQYDTKEYPVEVIIKKRKDGLLIVPDYQREYVWDNKRKSRFIESVFLGVPIMPFLVSVSGENAELEIIDGSQRIQTLEEYCNDGFKLNNLQKLTSLNGTRFSNLSEARKNKFLLRDFRLHVVTEKADSEIRADIFSRVNTSSNKLTDSEVRRGAFQGKFYDFIMKLSKDPLFRKLCPCSATKTKRREHEELVLRFFAFSETYHTFKHDVAKFLDDFVIRHKDNFDESRLRNNFNNMLRYVDEYFPEPYFARIGNSTPRVRFEALAVGVHLALQKQPQLGSASLKWIDSKEFAQHTRSDASNNPGRLKERVEFVRDCLLGFINLDNLQYD